MKNLDLNGLGVQEMNATEMREVDGGIIPLIIAAAAVVTAVLFVVGQCCGLAQGKLTPDGQAPAAKIPEKK